ncbi:MAG: tetratricopeptide repeat protein [Planctomycetes bacterium]|nr:tetratricopeptide repeat protein [Planctomycetota bacterium]
MKAECPKCKKQYSFGSTTEFFAQNACADCGAELKMIGAAMPGKVASYKETLKPVSGARAPSETRADDGLKPFDDAPEEVKTKFKELVANKYLITDKIGQGGMGAVYKAWDSSLKRYVAIKMILPGDTDTPTHSTSQEEIAGRFIREAQTAANLIHPNILQIYEVGRHGENHFIAMEYVKGGTLEEYWGARHEGTLPGRRDILEYVALMVNVIKGMDFAHRQNIIHRDIKPANILLTDAKTGKMIPKLSDFGLAKKVSSDKNITIAGTIMGTPAYMSPEQSVADTLDARSDIFSLGSVLYWLVTGREPFAGESYLDVLNAVANKEPDLPGSINKAAERDLEIIILKAMEKDKERRYGSAGEFAEDLERYLAGEAILARPASTAYKVIKKLRKNKPAIAGIAAGILIASVMLTIVVMNYYKKQRDAGNYLRKADELVAQGQWKEAGDYYIKYLEIEKEDSGAEKKKELCAQKIKDEKEASEEAQTAWLYANQVFPDFYKKGTDMEKVWKHIDDSMKILDKSIRKYPTPMAYFYRAMLNREKDDLTNVENDLSESIKLKPDFDLAYIMRGITRLEQGKGAYHSARFNTEMSRRQQAQFESDADADFSMIKQNSSVPEQFQKYKMIFEAINIKQKDLKACVKLLEDGYRQTNSEEFLFWLAQVNPSGLEYLDKVIEIKPQHVRAYFERGFRRWIKEDADGAIADYTQAIRIIPSFARAYCERAAAKRLLKGDIKGAIDDCNEAIRLAPGSPEVYMELADTYLLDEKLDYAIVILDKAAGIAPNFSDIYSRRGYIKSLMGDMDGAIKDHVKAIELNSLNAFAYYELGYIYIKKGDSDAALGYFTKSIETKTNESSAFLYRADIRMKKGDMQGAIEDYTKGIELESKNSNSYFLRGEARYKMNDMLGAIEDYTAVIRMRPDNELAYYNRGVARLDEKDIDGAVEDFSKAIEIKPKFAEAYFQRAIMRVLKKDYDNAIMDFEKALQLNKDYEGLIYSRGILNAKEGDYKNAAGYFELLVKNRPDFADAYDQLAYAKYETGDYAGSMEALDKLEQLTPGKASVLISRGLIMSKKGETNAAIAEYEKAIAIDPQNAMPYFELGGLYRQKGDLAKSIEYYTKAVENDPKPIVYYTRGLVRNEALDYVGAIEDYTQAVKLDVFNPDNVAIFIKRASAKAAKGDFAGAAEDCGIAINLDSEYAPAYSLIARAYFELGMYDDALAVAQKAMELDPALQDEFEPFIQEIKKKQNQ